MPPLPPSTGVGEPVEGLVEAAVRTAALVRLAQVRLRCDEKGLVQVFVDFDVYLFLVRLGRSLITLVRSG